MTTEPALAPLGYCAGPCREFTGRCGANHVAVGLLATGLVCAPGWPHPCTTAGTECWRVTAADGSETVVVLCPAHAGRLRGGGAAWMHARGVQAASRGAQRDAAGTGEPVAADPAAVAVAAALADASAVSLIAAPVAG